MIKKIILILSVVLVTFFFILSIYNSGTPDLTISINNEQLQIVKPINGWNTLLKHTNNDHRIPLEIAKPQNAITVKPNTLLNLKFDRDAEYMEVSLWTENDTVQLPSANTIGVPENRGIYVYRVVGQWKQGIATYIFKIKVD